MQNNKPYILHTLLTAVLEIKEHPEAKDCIGNVNDFLEHISNEDILKGCSISWDDTNKGFLLLWDDVLPNYLFKADLLVCKDYYQYNFIIRDREGNYIDSGGESEQIYSQPFWKLIAEHLENVYTKGNPLAKRIY